LSEQASGYLATGFFVIFLGWYAYATFANRRKLVLASRWVSELVKPFGGTMSIKWISMSAFHVTLQGMSEPFSQSVISVLLKPRDLVATALVNRLIRRNDLLLIRCELSSQPIWGMELYRPRTILSGLAKREVLAEQWEEVPTPDRQHLLAHGGGRAEALSDVLLKRLGVRRDQIWRLSVRRRFPQLLLAIDLPELTDESAADVRTLMVALAEDLKDYSTV
jgi:hypothetical protein